MARWRAFFVLQATVLLVALPGADMAAAASPWDGEWEGEVRSSRQICAPCRVRLTIKDGIPNVRGDVSIPDFKIADSGKVSGLMVISVPGYKVDCALHGQIAGDTLTAMGLCTGSGDPPEVTMRRVSGSGGVASAVPPADVPKKAAPSSPPAAPAPSSSSDVVPPGRPIGKPSGAEASFGSGTQSVRLADLTYEMPTGERIGELQIGNWLTSCGNGKKIVVTRKTFTQPSLTGYQAIFSVIGKSRGYTVTGLVDNNGTAAASYLVTGRITAMDWVGCLRENSNPPLWSGSGNMTIAWQVVRASDGQPVYSFTTRTSSSLPTAERRTDGLAYLYVTTFGDAVVQLVSEPGFRNAIRAPLPAASAARNGAGSAEQVRTPPLFRGTITSNMKSILPAVVEIRPGEGVGSGFVVDPGGLVLTNAHVVRGVDSVSVVFSDGQKLDGTVVRRDLARDVALIRVARSGLKALPIRRGEPVLTEKVYAIGSPFGLSQTVTEGIVSSYRRQQNGLDLIQATAAISPGNSGGPLLDGSGNVIGISQFLISPGVGTDFRFFIPIESALSRLELRLVGR